MSDDRLAWIHPAPVSEGRRGGCPTRETTDYKFYCFGGEPRYLYVSRGLESHETARISFLSAEEWAFAPFGRTDYAPFEGLPPRPRCYDEMLGLARELAAGMPFVRVDLFEHRGRPRFGELTLYPCAGFMPFDPPEWDERVGGLLDVPGASAGIRAGVA